MGNNKQHIYLMPGLGANSLIFEYLQFPKDKYCVHLLDWFMPIKNESLNDYCIRLSNEIKHENIILIGVSFGGVIVQELSRLMSIKKLIIISSIKNKKELPKNFRLIRATNIHKIFPMSTFNNFFKFLKYSKIDKIYKRINLADRYLTVRDKDYLKWSINCLLNWDQETTLDNIIHIHGNSDHIFPIKYIKDSIVIENGRHEMIITRAKWFNQNLVKIIEN